MNFKSSNSLNRIKSRKIIIVFKLNEFVVQTIQHRLAEMKTKIALTRSFTDDCLEMHSNGKLDGAMASMNKYWWVSWQVNRKIYIALAHLNVLTFIFRTTYMKYI